MNGTCTPEEFQELVKIFGGNHEQLSLNAMMKEAWNADIDVENVAPDKVLLGQIHHQIALQESRSSSKLLRWYKIGLQLAAVLIVGLLIASVYFFEDARRSDIYSNAQCVTTPLGATTSFKLPDGSTVWLNSGSQITYSGNFKRQRSVNLKGEAFFDVPETGLKFQVNTVYGKVQVLGTSFNVKAYPADNFITTLAKGKVEVFTDSGNEKQILVPGNQSYLDANKKLQKRDVDIEEFIAWKDGKLMFVRKSLVEVVEMLERWYNVEIELEAKETKGLWFTGTIEKETISEVLELIKTTVPIEYSFNSKTRILKIRAK